LRAARLALEAFCPSLGYPNGLVSVSMWEDPGRDTSRRHTVTEAAAALGITVDAVRSRVKRGTIDHVREGGRVYVLLGTDQGGDQGNRPPQDQSESSALISELRAHNDTLREQLEAERQAHAESRRLLAAALERIPAIESPVTPEEASEGPETGEVAGAPQEATQRPWWRRIFGG
jgi:hypothetical protein